MAQRQLSKTMRKMNLAYKVIMAVLAGVSLMLATLTDTDAIYYKFVSVFSSAFPIVWSQILAYSEELNRFYCILQETSIISHTI